MKLKPIENLKKNEIFEKQKSKIYEMESFKTKDILDYLGIIKTEHLILIENYYNYPSIYLDFGSHFSHGCFSGTIHRLPSFNLGTEYNNNNEININNNENRNISEKNKEEKKKAKVLTDNEIWSIMFKQDLFKGFWEENEKTIPIKEKYKKEYDLLRGLKNINITDKIAMTVIIIYFMNKEHPDLLSEFSYYIKKGKNYILKETKNTYENIIKETEEIQEPFYYK